MRRSDAVGESDAVSGSDAVRRSGSDAVGESGSDAGSDAVGESGSDAGSDAVGESDAVSGTGAVRGPDAVGRSDAVPDSDADGAQPVTACGTAPEQSALTVPGRVAPRFRAGRGGPPRYRCRSAAMRSAASRPETIAVGTPVPGWVLAPAKYRFGYRACRLCGRR